MNENDFVTFMRAENKPATTIKSYINSVKTFETFLSNHKRGANPEDATAQDLADFVDWGKRELGNVYRHLWGVKSYFGAMQNEEMQNSVSEWMEILQNEIRRLGEFPGVDRTAVKKLMSIGIRTASQLLHAGKTQAHWSALAERSGASLESILELVRLSNLARLPGLKKVRGRLFYEAGLDTLQKIASRSPEEIQRLLAEYVKTSGFAGVPPTSSEAKYTIRMARYLAQKEAS